MTPQIIYGKAIASIAICVLGGYCIQVSKGETDIGWSVLGLLLIWG